jgi:hypothetical protein
MAAQPVLPSELYPSNINLSTLPIGLQIIYSPNTNTRDIRLVVGNSGTTRVLVDMDNVGAQFDRLTMLDKYAWDLDPTHRNQDGTIKRYGGKCQINKMTLTGGPNDGRSLYDCIKNRLI